ncbi:MAG: cell division protein ZapE [Gammaproteobacteria bacterium]|nr:cell division protein ZapE [Gammaproteobacteria bacterium]
MTPKEYYQQEINAGHIRPDDRQYPIIEKLETIFLALTASAKNKKSLLNLFRSKKPIKGLYLWGSVGIGKTFLMDCLYHCLEVPKIRLHFHQFMLRMHEDLHSIQGIKNPLAVIAKKIAQTADVICFDEFFVSNIADAMILGELFLHLFANGVTLVTSSNIPPHLLYKEGLQRERFLPAIQLIEENTEVVHLHSKMDYRKQHIHNTGVYYFPLNLTAQQNMENAFIHFSNGAAVEYDPITIYERKIPIIKQAASVIWFDFSVICGRPRSQNDYLALTKMVHTVMIENLSALKSTENDLILSFIYLVDILYDAHCRLIISSAVPIDEIYRGDNTQQPFQRTLSRLIEMQSEAYVYPEISDKTLTNL